MCVRRIILLIFLWLCCILCILEDDAWNTTSIFYHTVLLLELHKLHTYKEVVTMLFDYVPVNIDGIVWLWYIINFGSAEAATTLLLFPLVILETFPSHIICCRRIKISIMALKVATLLFEGSGGRTEWMMKPPTKLRCEATKLGMCAENSLFNRKFSRFYTIFAQLHGTEQRSRCPLLLKLAVKMNVMKMKWKLISRIAIAK